MQFQVKPRTIEAQQWDGHNLDVMRLFCGLRTNQSTGASEQCFNKLGREAHILEYQHRGAEAEVWCAEQKLWLPVWNGDWVVKDEDGLIPVKRNRFGDLYQFTNYEGAAFKPVPPQAFMNDEATVICLEGENFYKACDALVRDFDDGQTHCVKRVGHPSVQHEDYEGRTLPV